KLTAEAFLVAAHVGLVGSVVAASVSQTGILVLSSGPAFGLNLQLAWWARNGTPLGDVGPFGIYVDFSLSPDRKRLAVARNVDGLDLWLLDLVRGGLTRFTFDPANDRYPVWSPDGTRIVYTRS